MFYGIFIAIHILVCLILILVVLLQSGKGGGLAGAFGAAGGQTGQALFGGRGAATFLSKMTTALGALFLLTSLTIALMSANRSGPESVIRGSEQAPGSVAPALDAPAPDPGMGGLEDLQAPAGQETPGPGIVEPATGEGEEGQAPAEGSPAPAEEPGTTGGGQ